MGHLSSRLTKIQELESVVLIPFSRAGGHAQQKPDLPSQSTQYIGTHTAYVKIHDLLEHYKAEKMSFELGSVQTHLIRHLMCWSGISTASGKDM